jgi:hypothetical protein
MQLLQSRGGETSTSPTHDLALGRAAQELIGGQKAQLAEGPRQREQIEGAPLRDGLGPRYGHKSAFGDCAHLTILLG